MNLPGCNELESTILRMRADNRSFWQIAHATGVGPRRLHRIYQSALRKLVKFGEQATFLGESK